MYLRTIIVLFAIGSSILFSCGPQAPRTPTIGRNVTAIQYLNTHLDVEILVDPECVHTGQPAVISATITNTGDIAYTQAYTQPVFDLILQDQHKAELFRWSDSLPRSQQPYTITLMPQQAFQMTMTVTIPPHVAGYLIIGPTIWHHAELGWEDLNSGLNRSRLLPSINQDNLGLCP